MDALAEKEGLMPTDDEVSMSVYRMGFDALGDDKARLRKLISDPDMRRAASEMLVNAKVMAFLGHSCDADPESARCDECEPDAEAPTSDADELEAHDSEGEAQE